MKSLRRGKQACNKGYNAAKPRGLKLIGKTLFKICKRTFIAILSATSTSVHVTEYGR
jgi:hypothetical protein